MQHYRGRLRDAACREAREKAESPLAREMGGRSREPWSSPDPLDRRSKERARARWEAVSVYVRLSWLPEHRAQCRDAGSPEHCAKWSLTPVIGRQPPNAPNNIQSGGR